MLGSLKTMLGFDTPVDFAALVAGGAQIVDVRTRDEFRRGHIRGAVNVPLQELQQGASRLRKERPVITCCASGMRSAAARSTLASMGFTEVHNGGGWASLQGKLGG